MTTKTDNLIEQLASGLAPVRPLRAPGLRAAWWTLAAVFYLAILTFARSGFSFALDSGDVGFLMIQLVGAVVGVLAAIAAFASVVPGRSNRTQIWAAIAAIAWLAIMVFSSPGVPGNESMIAAEREWACVAIILVGGAPLVAAFALMLRKGAPLHPVRTALLGALAVGLLANFGACISAPHVADTATLAWHGGAVLALILVCIAGAGFVLRWKPASPTGS